MKMKMKIKIKMDDEDRSWNWNSWRMYLFKVLTIERYSKMKSLRPCMLKLPQPSQELDWRLKKWKLNSNPTDSQTKWRNEKIKNEKKILLIFLDELKEVRHSWKIFSLHPFIYFIFLYSCRIFLSWSTEVTCSLFAKAMILIMRLVCPLSLIDNESQ